MERYPRILRYFVSRHLTKRHFVIFLVGFLHILINNLVHLYRAFFNQNAERFISEGVGGKTACGTLGRLKLGQQGAEPLGDVARLD